MAQQRTRQTTGKQTVGKQTVGKQHDTTEAHDTADVGPWSEARSQHGAEVAQNAEFAEQSEGGFTIVVGLDRATE